MTAHVFSSTRSPEDPMKSWHPCLASVTFEWTSHQESWPFQVSTFGKSMPVRNRALKTGTKLS